MAVAETREEMTYASITSRYRPTNHTQAGDKSIPTIIVRAAREDAKARQIIIDDITSAGGGQAVLRQITKAELIEKANIAIDAIHRELRGLNAIKAVRKLFRGGIAYEMDTGKLGEKLRSKEIREKFLANFSSMVAV